MTLFQRTDLTEVLTRLRSMDAEARTKEVQAELAKGQGLPYPVLTAEGVARAQARVAAIDERLVALRKDKNESFELSGDGWHDNPGWRQIKSMEEALLEDKVRLLTMIEEAVVIDPSTAGEGITIGSQVALRRDGTASEEIDRYRIVGLEEVIDDEPEDETPITYETPLARLLLGRQQGDRVERSFGGRPEVFVIESVE